MPTIRRAVPADLPALTALLVEAIAHGASISFMAGFSHAEAMAFWTLKIAALGHVLLIAADGDQLIGTVTLAIDTPPNQPHRADVQKMIVARTAQRQGVGAALMAALETEARIHGRTLLVLDTINGSTADRLYERCGWTRVGAIPDYALMPAGGLAPTTIFFKRV